MMRVLRRLSALPAIVWGLACADSNPAGAPVLHLTPEVRIGGEDTGPDFLFSEIAAIIPHDSLVFVTQRAEPTVRVYDLDGRFVRRIGRRGSGPGEFDGSAWKVGLIADTLWVIDEGRRVSYFALNGDLLKTTTYGLPAKTALAVSTFFFEMPQALSVAAGAIGFGGYAEYQRAAGRIPFMPILSFTRDMRTIDTLAWVSTANGTVDVPRGPYRVQPFSDEPLLAYSPSGDRVFIADRTAATDANAANRIWLRREDADTLVRYTVLDTNGTEAASVFVPRHVTILWASANHVWGQELDPDDVPTIVRFRIDTPTRSD